MRSLRVNKSSQQEGTPPTEREMAEMGRLIDEMLKEGTLLATEGCLPSVHGARASAVPANASPSPMVRSRKPRS